MNLLIIENIGDLVCLLRGSIWEKTCGLSLASPEQKGDDKPAKYPQMFAASQVMIINKLNLLPYVDYDMEKVKRHALAINRTCASLS